jgi:protein O-GlcNAc transferase
MFKAQGIAEERIELLSHVSSYREHLNTYNRIDICLDTFPYHGTTTTCEALWMGVPIISLSGNSHASRVGTSILSNIGLPELIAKSRDKYLEIAINLSKDLKSLQSLRKKCRHMMLHSPLTEAKQFTVNLQQCYRTIWERWCKETISKGLRYLRCK